MNEQEQALFPNSSSLVSRAGQIMAVIIGLGMLSMISSMLVSESLSGDAAQINHAGALRMQAVRISRAYLADDTVDKAIVREESELFERRLNHLFSGGILPVNTKPVVVKQYQQVKERWAKLKTDSNAANINRFEPFIKSIDKLVSLLQQESEKKLNLLRLIQGISLFALLLVSAFVLFKLNKMVILPLKELVNVAQKIAKGDFTSKVNYHLDNELGVLANAMNQMSNEIQITYQNFEQRVNQKTQALVHSNESLALLFSSARKLTNHQYNQISHDIITETQTLLGIGKVSIELNASDPFEIDSIPIETTLNTICFNQFKCPLEKQSVWFGDLVWHIPKGYKIEDWQKQLLQAMADIIATAIELEQTRNTENRLLIVEERAVIARELHDSLAQSLSYLKVQVSLLERKMAKQVPAESTNETITDIKSGLNSAYQQLRELLTTFRLKLEDPAIENAIKGTVVEFSAKCQHPITLNFALPKNFLNANQEIHMLQIIREALSNVHRHAKASNASVEIMHQQNEIYVTISDNGIGIPETLDPQGHFGLGIMEERAKSLNTFIQITNNAPQGTRISFHFTR
jgi:two-component system nitrate/nitrite sensor histidine kinase NarX